MASSACGKFLQFGCGDDSDDLGNGNTDGKGNFWIVIFIIAMILLLLLLLLLPQHMAATNSI